MGGAEGMAASNSPERDAQPRLVEVRGVVKRFGGVVALNGASLDIRPGEVHALVGETAPANQP